MERGQFKIGDDEDQDDDAEGDEPPSYDDVSAGEQINVSGDDDLSAMNRVEGVSGDEEKEVEMEVVEVKHPVSRSDTLLGIARKYAADVSLLDPSHADKPLLVPSEQSLTIITPQPHDLLTLNNLPPTTLSAHPHLLHTRRTLLISRRLVPKSSLPSTLLFSAPDLEPNPEEAARREKERQVKRFQLMTKTVDPGVGAAYLGLSELEENRDVLDDGSGEGLEVKGGTARGKKVWREEGNRTERALEAFFEDDGWEREVGGPARAGSSGGLGKWKFAGSGVGSVKV